MKNEKCIANDDQTQFLQFTKKLNYVCDIYDILCWGQKLVLFESFFFQLQSFIIFCNASGPLQPQSSVFSLSIILRCVQTMMG